MLYIWWFILIALNFECINLEANFSTLSCSLTWVQIGVTRTNRGAHTLSPGRQGGTKGRLRRGGSRVGACYQRVHIRVWLLFLDEGELWPLTRRGEVLEGELSRRRHGRARHPSIISLISCEYPCLKHLGANALLARGISARLLLVCLCSACYLYLHYSGAMIAVLFAFFFFCPLFFPLL